MPTFPELGRALKRARLAQTLTQTEVARLGHVTVGYYGNVERGDRRPTPEVLLRLSRAVGADYAEIATAAGFAPASIGEFTITVESLEKAAWLRQLAARCSAEELEALYGFYLQWQPRATAAAEREDKARAAG